MTLGLHTQFVDVSGAEHSKSMAGGRMFRFQITQESAVLLSYMLINMTFLRINMFQNHFVSGQEEFVLLQKSTL